jgi:hypothetical protein
MAPISIGMYPIELQSGWAQLLKDTFRREVLYAPFAA